MAPDVGTAMEGPKMEAHREPETIGEIAKRVQERKLIMLFIKILGSFPTAVPRDSDPSQQTKTVTNQLTENLYGPYRPWSC